MKTFVVIEGPISSGKTTLARALQKALSDIGRSVNLSDHDLFRDDLGCEQGLAALRAGQDAEVTIACVGSGQHGEKLTVTVEPFQGVLGLLTACDRGESEMFTVSQRAAILETMRLAAKMAAKVVAGEHDADLVELAQQWQAFNLLAGE